MTEDVTGEWSTKHYSRRCKIDRVLNGLRDPLPPSFRYGDVFDTWSRPVGSGGVPLLGTLGKPRCQWVEKEKVNLSS